MAEVITDGKIVVPFTFDNKTDVFVFASIERLENQIAIVRAARDRAEHDNDPASIRLAAELAELTDAWARQYNPSAPRQDYGASGDLLDELLLARMRLKNGAGGSRSDRDKEPEPGSSTPGDPEPRKGLNDDLSKAAASVIAALKAGGDDATALREVFAQAGQPISDAAAPTATPSGEPPSMELPTVAPKLWRDHPPGMTATEFVRQVYAPWIEAGVLTRKAIEDCDPALANAYSKRKSAYPDEAIPLARAVHPRTIADPQQASEHYRAKSRERTARYRNRDKIAHEPN